MIGTVLSDRYPLDTELGRGGMGVVYRAHDTLLKRDVAVKVLAAALNTEGRARLLHEAQAAGQLNHPNIVTVYDVEDADDTPFIVMELIKGESLHSRRPSGLKDIISIARQVCAALEHAHAHGIVHRDLKPENVMVAPDGSAKLMDFGLSRSVASRLTSEGTITGTVFYLAPELALGQEFDGRADLYALGVMLYELTTGRVPFTADDPLAVISQHLHAPIVPPRARNDRIPPALDALILRLLNKSPLDRPASAAEVLQALDQPGFLEREIAPAAELSVLERIERGRLVGREQELEEGRVLWNRALSAQGQTLLVSGEPGIGKTRLVRELVTQAEVSGGRALVGAGYSEGDRPYGAFRQILRQALRDLPGDGFVVSTEPSPRAQAEGFAQVLPEFVLADMLTLVPELRLRYPEIEPNPTLDDPRAEQGRLFENLVIFFTALSDHTPLLLFLEDVHWADSGTLFLLRHLARHTRQARVLIVATYREVELDEARPLHEVLLDLNRERLAIRLKLPRLNREQTRELLAVLFDEGITPEFLGGIYRETEGNPFFIEEVCKALVESGKLTYQDGLWHGPSTAELGIPQSVRVAIQSRVRVLPPGTQEILRLAAVLGREFDFDILAAASDQDKDALIEVLESAERAQLIEEVSGEGEGTFAFVHSLFASTLVESTRTLQRRRLHRRAAAAIETLHADDDSHLGALANHYSQAGEAEKATKYLLRAADQALVLGVHQEAIEYYQKALEFLKEQEEHERAARTLMMLGLVYHNAFDFKAARQAYEEGFALWLRVGETLEGPPPPPAPHALRCDRNVPGKLNLDPAMVWTRNIESHLLFSGLVRAGLDGSVAPEVARTWEVLEGGRKYVFQLRDDWSWSDGTPVTAGDFEYAWKRVLDPATGARIAELLYDIKGARAFHQGQVTDPNQVGVQSLGEFTLVVELERPAGYFLHLLTNEAWPVPRHAVEAHGEAWTKVDNFVTNGPFILDAWQPGQFLVFSRAPLYPGRSRGNVQRLEFLSNSVKDWAARLEAYEAGDLDWLNLSDFPPTEIDRVRQRHAGEYFLIPGLTTGYVAFDVSRPPFDDARVRRAFVLATDRETLADVFMRGYVSPATGGFVPPRMPGHSAEIGLPYDPERARQLLAVAGYPGGRGFPGVDAQTSRWRFFMSEHLLAQWQENLGVEVRLEILDSAVLLDRQKKDRKHIDFLVWWADYPDPDNFLRVAVDIIRRRSTSWRNEAYERLVEKARRILDQGERMELYAQADKILVEDAAIMPVFHGQTPSLFKPWVRPPARFTVSPFGFLYLQNVIIEPH